MAESNIDSSQLSDAVKNQYDVLEQLGRGAFGTVFKAVQKSTGQQVAIKVQVVDQTEGDTRGVSLRRFEREARLCATLNHPNIVHLIDQGASGKHVFIVFEYVPGETLAELLARRGSLPAGEAVSLMGQVLEGLEEAHARGIVHRDLKPENLMVITTGTQTYVKILDFGIGAFVASGAAAAPALTGSRELLGTPSYCSPEQLRGEPATARSDLYAWGLVLLECLTGRRVMDGATVAQVIYRQLSAREIPLPPALATHPLGDVLRRVLAKAPHERSGDAGKLWNDLRRINTADLVGLLGAQARSPALAGGTMAVEAARPSGEKRQATLLCCSLSAAPAPGSGVELETVNAVHRDQLSLCVDVATRFGGHLAGALGDRLLVVFGLPDVSDSDARRAAHAALELASRVNARRAALAQRGITLELRIAVHTDIVVVDLDGTPAGPALGIAGRLEAAAPAGAVVVSAATRDLLARQLHFEPLLPAAGAPALPVAAYRVLVDRAGPGRAAFASELVGRDAEREALCRLWADAGRGRGQVAIVRGEPGIGKSRLVQELRLHADDAGDAAFLAQCLPEDSYSALSPILGAVRRQFELLDHDPRPGLARVEAALGRRGLDAATVIPILRVWLCLSDDAELPATQLSPERQRAVLLDALAKLICPVEGEDPRLLIIEDLQWSDPTSRELVLRVASLAPAHRMLLVLTTRFEIERSPAEAHVIHLQGLDRTAVERLIAAQIRGGTLGRTLVEQIRERTDGVPLFVEELTRSLLEAQDGRPGERLGDASVPASLRDLLNGRLGRLGAARETAQVAAAIGRDFGTELLTLVSTRSAELVQADLERLVEAQLLDRAWEAGGTRYVFRHALIREAAWESMLSAQRRAIHRAVADTIEARFPAEAKRQPAHLARHYELAGVPDRAADYRLRAAQRAILESSYQEALEHLQGGLALVELVEEPGARYGRELELRNTLGGVLLATQGFASDAVVGTFTRARALLDLAAPAPLQRLVTLKGLWTFHHARGNYPVAQEVIDQLMALAAANDRPEFHLTAHQTAAETAFLTGRFRDTLHHSGLNDQWFDPQQQREQVIRYGIDPWLSALSAECISAALLGRIKHARRRMAKGLAICENLNSATHRAQLLAQAAAMEMMLATPGGRPSAALDLALARVDEALAIAQRHGLMFAESYARLIKAMMAAVRGDEQGLADLQQSIALWKMMGVGAALSWNLSFLARGQHLRRDYPSAVQSARSAVEHARQLGEGYGESEAYRTLGVLLSDPESPLCDRVEGTASCVRALEVATQQEAHWLELQAAYALGRHARGDVAADARRRLAQVAAWFVREDEGADLPFRQEVLGPA